MIQRFVTLEQMVVSVFVYIKLRILRYLSLISERIGILSQRHHLDVKVAAVLYLQFFVAVPLVLVFPLDWGFKISLSILSYLSLYLYIVIVGVKIPFNVYALIAVLGGVGLQINFNYSLLSVGFALVVMAWGTVVVVKTKIGGVVMLKNKIAVRIVEQFEPADFGITWQTLADAFDHSYRRPPWNEAGACNICKPVEEDSPSHRYGLAEIKGLNGIGACGHQLGKYWTEERTHWYIQEMYSERRGLMPVAVVNGEFAGAFFGYWIDNTIYYLDVIYVVPKFRRQVDRFNSLREFIFLLKMRFSPARDDFLTKLLTWTDPPVIVRLYLSLSRELKKKGCQIFRTRVHRKSRIVNKLLKLMGLKQGEAAAIDSDRIYFERRI